MSQAPLDLYPVPQWARPVLGHSDGGGLRVAVIDSGYRAPHHSPGTCGPNVADGHGLVDPEDELRLHWSDDVVDRIGHGTACAQIIHRMAPAATLVPLRVFGSRLETSPETILAALRWAIDHGCDLVNLSLGTRSSEVVRPFYRLCEQAHDQGMIIVAALPRGEEVSYPAVFEPVLSVTLGDVESPFDFAIQPGAAAELCAFGHHRTWWKGQERQLFGSSFAAPHITGMVARLLGEAPRQGLAAVRRRLADLAERRRADAGQQATPAASDPPPSADRARPGDSQRST